jgi:hypothetical protein
MMTEKMYGKYSAESFHADMTVLSPECVEDEGTIQYMAAWMRKDNFYEDFKEALVALIKDDSLSFQEKAGKYLEEDMTSGRSWDYFKWVWEHFAPGEPWPLEGTPRPPDESPQKWHEFKPE